MSELDLLLVALVSLSGSFVKAVTGMGYPLLAIPVLTLAIGVESAVAVIAVPNLVANALLMHGTRGERSATRDLPVLVTTAVFGAVLGTFVLVEAPERPLVLGLAATVLVYVVQRLRSPDLRLAPQATRRWSPLVGTLAGFSHGAIGASGPIVAVWLHGYRLPRNAYVFSIAAIFFVGGLAQLAVLIAAEAFGRDRIVASGVALVATVAVIPLGARVRARIARERFEQWVLAVLVVSGLSLLWRGLV